MKSIALCLGPLSLRSVTEDTTKDVRATLFKIYSPCQAFAILFFFVEAKRNLVESMPSTTRTPLSITSR